MVRIPYLRDRVDGTCLVVLRLRIAWTIKGVKAILNYKIKLFQESRLCDKEKAQG